MIKKLISILLFLNAFLLTQPASSCAGHGNYGPHAFGFPGRSFPNTTHPSPKETLLKLKHPPMAKVALGEEHQFLIEYERPWFSNNVRLELSSSQGVLLHNKVLPLVNSEGSILVRFTLQKGGFNKINIKVSGEHKGQNLQQSSVVYVQVKKTSPTKDVQVSIR